MSGQDPFADMMNISGYVGGQGPGVMGGLVGQNPYLTYQGAIPMPGVNTRSPFTGPVTMGPQDQLPTTAWGTTIQPPYGTTLYQTPQQPAQAPTPTPQSAPQSPLSGNANDMAYAFSPAGLAANPNSRQVTIDGHTGYQARLTPQQQATQNDAYRNAQNLYNPGGYSGPGTTQGAQNYGSLDTGAGRANLAYLNSGAAGGAPPAQSSQAQPAAPQTGLTRDQYLYLLANPGKPPSFGADPPGPGQVRTGTGSQPSVIQAFMNAHPGGGTTGAGGYNNTGFFNTLKQLQGGVG